MQEWGWTNPVLADEAGGIIAGHGRVLAARKLGLAEAPVMIARGWSEAQKRAYVLADNKLALNAGWDDALLKIELADLAAMGFELPLIGFGEDEIARLSSGGGLTDPDDAPDAPADPVTALGDIWLLGKHRLACGDSTQPPHVDQLLGKARPDCVLTDPPYCSGGFQEAGRAIGSIGSDGAQHKKGGRFEAGIANDKLSTRGYIALMKAVLGLCRAPMLYVFTDWRMWINLFDLAESSGYGVRNMIVWDKGTPGMGRGWRTQHELVLFGAKASTNFDNHMAVGNVVAAKRTGNPLHPTQKPIELLTTILGVTDMAERVYDPFAGSGTTLIACEQAGRTAYLMELSPVFADVAVLRWQAFTGADATLEGDGRTFNEIAAERQPKAQHERPQAETDPSEAGHGKPRKTADRRRKGAAAARRVAEAAEGT